MLTFPMILLGIVISTIYGTAFHMIKGGRLSHILLFVLLSWLGFWIGHAAGAQLGWDFAAVGQINLGMATLGSLVFLLVGEWLSRVEISKK